MHDNSPSQLAFLEIVLHRSCCFWCVTSATAGRKPKKLEAHMFPVPRHQKLREGFMDIVTLQDGEGGVAGISALPAATQREADAALAAAVTIGRGIEALGAAGGRQRAQLRHVPGRVRDQDQVDARRQRCARLAV